MRTRLSPHQRKAQILAKARELFRMRGYAKTEMEDIRQACALSRGGLYHHFGSKSEILDAIAAEEIKKLCSLIEGPDPSPIETLLAAGSSHLGADPGILPAFNKRAEKAAYCASLEQAVSKILHPVLAKALAKSVRADIDPEHVAELFLTVNERINRRALLGEWTEAQAASFAATALKALAPLMKDAIGLKPLIHQFEKKGTGK
ncbi:MAG: hypothetical protein Tsb0010_02880 [Parvularculaceae bacterium]